MCVPVSLLSYRLITERKKKAAEDKESMFDPKVLLAVSVYICFYWPI